MTELWEDFLMEFWIQAIGIVAMALNISAFQFKNKRTLLMIICVGSGLFSINMFLLGAITGGIMNLLGVVRSLVYVDKEKLPIPVKWVNAMFIVAYMISYVLSFTAFGTEPTLRNFLLELLPIIAMTAMTFAFAADNSKTVRLAGFINSPCWLIYNIFNLAIGGILCEIFALVSITSALIRIDILGNKRKEANQDEE